MTVDWRRFRQVLLLFPVSIVLLILLSHQLGAQRLRYEFSGVVADPFGPPDDLGLGGQALTAIVEVDAGANPFSDNGAFAGYFGNVMLLSPVFPAPLIGRGSFAVGYGTGLDQLNITLFDPPPGFNAVAFDTFYCVGLGCLLGDASLPAALIPPSSGIVIVQADDFSLATGGISADLSASVELTSDTAWTAAAALNSPGRASHTATLLNSGEVLVGGGFGLGAISSAELYDPTTGDWSVTGSLVTGRLQDHTATLLNDGRVLVTGGLGCDAGPCAAVSTTEIYDPAIGNWSGTGNLNEARVGHTATLLDNGMVLAAGGLFGMYVVASAELYDPSTGQWTTTGSMSGGREGHAATLLDNGKVLVSGGRFSSAELYDPNTGSWTSTGAMSAWRTRHTSTLLPNGSVLVTGGLSCSGSCSLAATSEMYIPSSGDWQGLANMNVGRYVHTANLVSERHVLVAGGADQFSPFPTSSVSSAEILDLQMGVWSLAPAMLAPRSEHTATTLPDGTVLTVGGWTSPSPDVEIFDPLRGFRPMSTTGVFRPTTGGLFLKSENTEGFADSLLTYGLPGDRPATGDWDGNGVDTIGVFRDGVFFLRNSNTNGFADLAFAFGVSTDLPVVGDWDGDGVDTIGVFRDGLFLLSNTNGSGPADAVFTLGVTEDIPISGDWDGDGVDTVGIFRPSNGALFLKNQNSTGFADIVLTYGLPGDKPVTGDWEGDGVDTIGVFRNGVFLLRNSNTNGFADIVFGLGLPGDEPISGAWGPF